MLKENKYVARIEGNDGRQRGVTCDDIEKRLKNIYMVRKREEETEIEIEEENDQESDKEENR